jgi:transcriptional regulator with XRE-family HTH domain
MSDSGTPDGDLGRAITILRVVRGWSQGILAKTSGVSPSAISEYERGRKTPELATLERILRAMEFPLSAIDHTRHFVVTVMAGTFAVAPPVPSPSIERPPPIGSSAVDWEINQASAQVGGAAARYFRIALHVLARRPLPDQDLAPDQEP